MKLKAYVMPTTVENGRMYALYLDDDKPHIGYMTLPDMPDELEVDIKEAICAPKTD